MPGTATALKQLDLPVHEHAKKHHLLLAEKKYGRRRRLQKVENLQPTGEVACERILEYALDLGWELGNVHGWKKKAATRMGLNYKTLWNIIQGHVKSVDTVTVDTVARKCGIPIPVFYDPFCEPEL